VPALQPFIIEPVWKQFSALLPEREGEHPLGCHRSRIPDRTIFVKLVEVLVFGCAYGRIADESCSATTLRRRRDEWIEGGLMDKLRQIALKAYDWTNRLGLSDVNTAYRTVRFASFWQRSAYSRTRSSATGAT
jgi:transposase